MADRIILQGLETTAQGKKLCRHIRERPAVPIMDSADDISLAVVSQIQVKIRLVALYVMFDTSREPFCQARHMGLVQRSVS